MTNGEIKYEEIKQISEKYMKEVRGITQIIIIFAKQTDGHWKVVVRYPTSDNPDTMSMLMINRKSKEVNYFREGITSF